MKDGHEAWVHTLLETRLAERSLVTPTVRDPPVDSVNQLIVSSKSRSRTDGLKSARGDLLPQGAGLRLRHRNFPRGPSL